MSVNITRRALLAAASALALASPIAAGAATVKNTILLVSDGASAGTWDVASYWQYGAKGQQTYDDFSVKLGMTTTPLNTSTSPTNTGTPQVSYDPAQAWSTAPSDGTAENRPSIFEGYEYLKKNYTDSAAASTALATGQKTYNNAIDYDDFGQPIAFISEQLKAQGKSTGIVTTVPVSHATPAGFGAQNISRNNYGELSSQMVKSGSLDLVMGAGNPYYDDNGNLLESPLFANETGPGTAGTTGAGSSYVAESVIDYVNDASNGWTYLQEKADFEALANGTLIVDGSILGLAKVGSTLQYGRTEEAQGADAANPSGVAFNPDVPDLATLTTGALNHLGKNEEGFFVMIEGGAVDWAAHANDTARIIEEQVDFNQSVTAAVQWVEANSSWEETLMLVLTDHGNGLPLGPNSDTIAFEQVQNNGAGVLPGVLWYTGNHTNENTLLWAEGAGSELLYTQVVGLDGVFAAIIGHNEDGAYIENTGVYNAIAMANGVAPIPLPMPIAFLIGGLAMLGGVSRLRRAA